MSQNVTAFHTPSRDVTTDKIRIEENIKEIKESSLRSDSFWPEQSCDSSGRRDLPGEKDSPVSLPEEKPFISLPVLHEARPHQVTQADVKHYAELYPAVDVRQQLRNMLGWLESNPKKRKTRTGMKGFITRWLADKQNRGGDARASPVEPIANTEYQKMQQERRKLALWLKQEREMENGQDAVETSGANGADLPHGQESGGIGRAV